MPRQPSEKLSPLPKRLLQIDCDLAKAAREGEWHVVGQVHRGAGVLAKVQRLFRGVEAVVESLGRIPILPLNGSTGIGNTVRSTGQGCCALTWAIAKTRMATIEIKENGMKCLIFMDFS